MRANTLFQKITGLLCFILVVIPVMLSAQSDDQPVEFRCNGFNYQVTAEPASAVPDGTDIILTAEGQAPVNLSWQQPGNNTGPIVSVAPGEDRFFVSWFRYETGNVQLYVFDSLTGSSRLLPLNQFKTAYPLELIFSGSEPLLLLFKGNNSDNTDIFYYHLHSGQVRNITQSPESDQQWTIIDEPNRVFIETRSVNYESRYRLKKTNLKIKRTAHKQIHRRYPSPQVDVPKDELLVNTVVGFGDSITYGVIQYSKDDYYYPEDAYLKQLERMMAEEYGSIVTINLGVPGDKTWMALERLAESFQGVSGYFCLIMLGTNDVVMNTFDVDESMESLNAIIDAVKDDFGMYVIVSTIPPQKDEQKNEKGRQLYIEKTENWNDAVIDMAGDRDIQYIDTYTAFFSGVYYWEDLLEPWKGNHPSPLGHRIIARLFQEKILALPPSMPTNIRSAPVGNGMMALWDASPEFDVDHYIVSFGYQPGVLNRVVTTATNYFQFAPFPLAAPFDATLYFTLQAVDKSGNLSTVTDVTELVFE